MTLDILVPHEHEHGLPLHDDGTGERRVLGTLPTPGHLQFVPMADADLIPESEWLEFELDDPTPVKDQNGRGACNGHAAAESLELGRWVNGYGTDELSAWYIYAPLCGGIDRGSSIGEALTFLTKEGTCLDGSVPYGTINPRVISAAAKAEAARFRMEGGRMLTTFEAIMSEVQRGRFGNFSIHVGGGFNDLDADGCPPASPGAGNHAVCFGLGAKRCKDGQWAIRWKNSWTTRWGLKGYAWFKAAHIARQAYFEAYSVLAASADPNRKVIRPC